MVHVEACFLPSKGEENDGGNLESDLAATGELKRKVDDCVVSKVEESSDGQDQRNDHINEDADAAIETVVLSDHQVDEAESVPRNGKSKLDGCQTLLSRKTLIMDLRHQGQYHPMRRVMALQCRRYLGVHRSAPSRTCI